MSIETELVSCINSLVAVTKYLTKQKPLMEEGFIQHVVQGDTVPVGREGVVDAV